MELQGTLKYSGSLEAIVTRADGSTEDLGIISGDRPVFATLTKPMSWYEKMWSLLKTEGKIPVTTGLFAFIAYLLSDHRAANLMLGIVTTAGVNYQASAFTGGPSISNFNFHDCGTGSAHGSTSTPTGATATTPIVVTQAGHGFGTNDIIQLGGITGITGINGIWQIVVNSSSTYTLLGSVGGGSGFGGGTNACQLVNGAGDTMLTTPAGTSRVAGTQSNPTSNVYKSVGSISFTSSLAISEWGLFSASTSGTLLDRRWFNNAGAPNTTATGVLTANTIGVNNGDNISFQYALTVTTGGQ
jgi:hypothetical protein